MKNSGLRFQEGLMNDVAKFGDAWRPARNLVQEQAEELKANVLVILNDLLMDEFLQRDTYQAYDYLMFGTEGIPVQEHLKEHLDQEMEHIRLLMRYITGMGGMPTVKRREIPFVSGASLKDIMRINLALEAKAVEKYAQVIQWLETNGGPELTALRVDLENIVSQEQEHKHDLDRWLKEP